MAVYNSGSVRVKVGSAEVKGHNTSFTTYAAVGNIFKLASESTLYQIASISAATKLTLTSRYSNTSYRTARAEYAASANSATRMYSGTLTYKPVVQSAVVVKVPPERFIDNGAGVLTGNLGGTGTIGYDDGALSITLGTTLTITENVTASYYSGNTLDSQPYQIVKDYTTYFKRALDPNNVMNPGKYLLDQAYEEVE